MTPAVTRRAVLGGLALAPLAGRAVPAGAGGVFRWSSTAEVLTWDPHAVPQGVVARRVQGHVNEWLVRIGFGPRLEPNLATGWRLVEPTVWEFDLRPGVRFHDGTPLTIEDVVFSLERAHADNAAATRPFLLNLAGLEAVGPTTLRLATRDPMPLMPIHLRLVGILPRAWAERHDVAAVPPADRTMASFTFNHANGTGPYRLVASDLARSWALERNPDWWGGGQFPYGAERIEWVRFANNDARIAALADGRLDYLFSPPSHRIEEIRRLPGVRWEQSPSMLTSYLVPDQGSPELHGSDVKGRNPFADRRVRQALYQAIDIDELIRRLGGLAVPRGMPVSPGINGYSPELDRRLPYDPLKARALLAEAGYPGGFRCTLMSSDPPTVTERTVAEMLGRIGIDVIVDPASELEQARRNMARTVDLKVGAYNHSSIDSYQFLLDNCHSRRDVAGSPGPDRPENTSGYANPKLDALIEAIGTEMVTVVRDALIERAWRIVLDDIVYIPLFTEIRGWAIRDAWELPIDPRVEPDFRLLRPRDTGP